MNIHKKINERAKLALLGKRYAHIPLYLVQEGNVIVLKGFLCDQCEEGYFWGFTPHPNGDTTLVFTRTKASWEEYAHWDGNSASLNKYGNPTRNVKFRRARI